MLATHVWHVPLHDLLLLLPQDKGSVEDDDGEVKVVSCFVFLSSSSSGLTLLSFCFEQSSLF